MEFVVDGVTVRVEGRHPTTTLLRWLRETGRVGTKEGCAEGDCGACTVVIADRGRWRAVNSCLVPLPSLEGQTVLTAEGLTRSGESSLPGSQPGEPHPAQRAMIEALGSQCGYCTPGFVMTLFEACHRSDLDAPWKLDDQLCGNLCRCTGYRPIRDALGAVAGTRPADGLAAPDAVPGRASVEGEGGGWLAPTSLDEATRFLADHPEARVIAGATDLGLDITQRHARFPALLSVERIAELRGVTVSDGAAVVGAATPLTDLEDWSAEGLPVLHRMLRFFGSRQIKHRATVGGNLCNASPIGDLAPVLLALGGSLELVSASGARVVPADAFFTAYRKTALAPGELLARIRWPLPGPGVRLGAYKVSRRRELDISAVSAAFAVDVGPDGLVREARLAYGGMAATPIRATGAEQALVGQPWTAPVVERAAAGLREALRPMSDHRATAEYRHRLAHNLLLGFFEETRERPFVELPDRPSGTVVEAP